ncbi:MAG TPA: 50S ribosomal protein L29 [Cellvibrionaceae bacterium]|jgi:large subunit ribosomal protein L29|nr:MAG: 50S ribosomal protein L29 [Moraxellaceae bacterium]
MNAKDLNQKSVDELKALLLEQHQEQFKFRMQSATGQLAQTHLLRQNRRTIARIKTVLSQKAGK